MTKMTQGARWKYLPCLSVWWWGHCFRQRDLFIQCFLLYIGQKRSPMKRSEVFKNSLFVFKLKCSDSYRRIFKSFSWDNFFTVGFKAQISLRSSILTRKVKITTQEVMECCFRFKTTAAHRIYGSSKVLSKFMFIQMTKINLRRFSSLTPFVSLVFFGLDETFKEFSF